jgi:hypothetical protein
MEFFNNVVEITKPIGDLEICQISNHIIINNNNIKLLYMVNDKTIKICSIDYIGYHVLRIIINKLGLNKSDWINSYIELSSDLLFDYFFIYNDLFQTNIYDYCTICSKIHDKQGLTYITSCNNSICTRKIYHYPVNNMITDLYKLDADKLLLMFRILLSGMTHIKGELVYKPLPILYNVNNINELINSIPVELLENNLEKIINIIETNDDDFTLYTSLHTSFNDNITYALLTNSISNNYYSISSCKDLVDINNKNINLEYYNVYHTTEIEKNFKSRLDNTNKYYYLYHGSPIQCWYSIIKNGLKVMSGTELMTTGAAYGAGIYFSNKIAMSYAYARPDIKFNYNIIGVFQLSINPSKYKKCEGIYVVNDESVLLLRTLIKINNVNVNNVNSGIDVKSFGKLDEYFITSRSIQKNINEKCIGNIKNKRLVAEIKQLDKYSNKFILRNISDDLDVAVAVDVAVNVAVDVAVAVAINKPWTISLIGLGLQNNIGLIEVEVEIQFNNYPLDPPFIKLINYNYPIKGIINDNYSINLPIIKPGNWSIGNNLVMVLDQIWNFFNESF